MFRLNVALRFAAVFTLVGAILFGSAGRTDLPFFWAYLIVLASLVLVTLLTVSRELLEERLKPAQRGRDNLALVQVSAIVILSSQWIVAGLDVGRFHWSDSVPLPLRVVALCCLAALCAVWHWAMRVNPFFSSAVRIQRDRGHHVVVSGPYRFVRHPGYAALVLLGWSGPLVLGSWWAVVPHVVVSVFLVRRAAIEDRMLREELEGYAAYAATVRYRLLPGVW